MPALATMTIAGLCDESGVAFASNRDRIGDRFLATPRRLA
jgi:hypothetical protein